jgi:hypothetical protein
MKNPENSIAEIQWLQFFNSALIGVTMATEPDRHGEIDEDECVETADALATKSLAKWIERWHPELAKTKGKGKKASDDDDEDEDDDETSEPDEVPDPTPRARSRRR